MRVRRLLVVLTVVLAAAACSKNDAGDGATPKPATPSATADPAAWLAQFEALVNPIRTNAAQPGLPTSQTMKDQATAVVNLSLFLGRSPAPAQYAAVADETFDAASELVAQAQALQGEADELSLSSEAAQQALTEYADAQTALLAAITNVIEAGG